MSIIKDTLDKARSNKVIPVDVSAWIVGGEKLQLSLRKLTANQTAVFGTSDDKPIDEIMAQLISMALVDSETLKPVLTYNEALQLAVLENENCNILFNLYIERFGSKAEDQKKD